MLHVNMFSNREFLGMKCRNPPGPGFLVEWLGSQKSVTSELMILRYNERVAKRELKNQVCMLYWCSATIGCCSNIHRLATGYRFQYPLL